RAERERKEARQVGHHELVDGDVNCVHLARHGVECRSDVGGLAISSGTTSSPSVCAAALVSSISSTGWALPALNTMPNRRRPATTSRNSSIRLPARLAACSDKPVTLPPGLARLATRPLPTGSMPTAKTIGMAL